MSNEELFHIDKSRKENSSAEAKKKSDEIQLFRQALQRQNDRASEMKMPGDMEQRVMKRIKSKSKSSRWLYSVSISAIAAGILILIGFSLLKNNGGSENQEPIMAQQKEQRDSTVKVEEKEPMPMITTERPVVAQNNNEQQTVETVKQSSKENETMFVVTDVDAAADADKLNYYISQLEAEMDAVDDSVREAHLEKLIAADSRLQQLVNRIVKDEAEQAYNKIKEDSTANYIYF